MSLRFTVLASGSGGNSSLIEVADFGLLLDAGLGPRQLAVRLASAAASWQSVHAVLLTHTHSDHWNERTLAHLARRGLPLYCHADHHRALEVYSPSFRLLCERGLVRGYQAGEDLVLAPGLRARPLPVRHDSGHTFGFRLEGAPDLFGQVRALAYAADLGCWDADLAAALADVDLLALEFNHDVELQYASGRSPRLIARVLGDEGHLSNTQAAALLREVLRRPGRPPAHVVQLHLSRDCNRPALAAEAARAVLAELAAGSQLHTAEQDRPAATIDLGAARRRPAARPPRPRATGAPHAAQPWLPGLDGQ